MPEIGVLGVIAAMLGVNATMIGVLIRKNNGRTYNGKPHHPTNPHNPEDLSQFRLGDMSAAWYQEQHNELLKVLKEIRRSVRARLRS
jgi:hypothetical protein